MMYSRERPYLLGDGAAFWGGSHYLTEHVGQITPNVRLKDRSDVSYYVSQYDGEIRYLDEHLGRFLAGIDDSGVGDETVIVVTSDHGESLGEHDTYFAHGTNVYDEQARIPLLIRIPDPDVKPKRVDEQVSGVDLLPTVLDLLGLPAPTSVRGRSLVPAILGRTLPDAPAFTETGPLENTAYKHSIRFQGKKLILNEDGVDDYALKPKGERLQDEPWGVLNSQKRFELHDLPADSGEARNLIRIPGNAYAELLQMLFSRAELGSVGTEPTPVTIDPETERLLRSLGYIH